MKRRNGKQKQTASLLNDWQGVLEPAAAFKERLIRGKEMRIDCPRTAHGDWSAPTKRKNPLELLKAQDATRLENLLPLRYWRMSQSPFAFYRGAAVIMANDLSTMPRTRALAQLCGDCHLSNFGIFATPERNVIFDLNDFDETLPGPFEWDLKRLAASFVVAAESNGFSEAVAARCVSALARVYREKMAEFSEMNSLDVWYERVDWEYLVRRIKKPGRKETAIENLAKLQAKRSHAGALAKLTEIVDGKRRIKDDPPTIYHTEMTTEKNVRQVLQTYALSLWESRRTLLQRYRMVDIAFKVVGVGSVGTAAAIVLLQGEGNADDHLFLQIKQAQGSVLEPYIGASEFSHPGNRIVNGQRLLQSASDLFLGWTSGPKRDFYIRQLMDVKASVPVDELDAVSLAQYAEVCAYVLARAHARSGDPAVIRGYLGNSDNFDEGLTEFALSYARQNEEDYQRLLDAIDRGKIKAQPGL